MADDTKKFTKIPPTQVIRRFVTAKRKRLISHLYTKGHSQADIADQLKVTVQTVRNTINELLEDWREDSIQELHDYLRREDQKIALVEKSAWDAWQDMMDNVHREVPDANGEMMTRYVPPNPQFLAIVLKAVETRQRLFKMDSSDIQEIMKRIFGIDGDGADAPAPEFYLPTLVEITGENDDQPG